MGWKFNPPPGWPVPAGWQPPAGYVPDPSWPPAPPGWHHWLPDSSTSDGDTAAPGTPAAPAVPEPTVVGAPHVPAYPDAKPWYQQWWAIAGAFLIVLLLGCAIGGALATRLTS